MGEAGAKVWQQCGAGVERATRLAPHLNLPAILGWMGERVAEERRRWPSPSLGADRASLYAPGLPCKPATARRSSSTPRSSPASPLLPEEQR